MAEIQPDDWLHWHSGRTAQDHAVRLGLACSAVIPSDSDMRMLVEQQIIADIVGLAFHGRRTMERRGIKDPSIDFDPLWPPSTKEVESGLNLLEAFGIIIHATKISVGWEKPDLSSNPYKGRSPQFAGHVNAVSDAKQISLPIGAIVGSFFGNVLKRSV